MMFSLICFKRTSIENLYNIQCIRYSFLVARVAQGLERHIDIVEVGGSIPPTRTAVNRFCGARLLRRLLLAKTDLYYPPAYRCRRCCGEVIFHLKIRIFADDEVSHFAEK